MPPPQHLLLCNPTAGGGRASRVLPEAEAALRAHGVAFRTECTRDLDHARTLADQAAKAGEAVVTLSGDGLVGCVAGVLCRHEGSVLGVLPGGRGNDFARTLGIPTDITAACGVVAAGHLQDLDVGEAHTHGEAGARTFIGIASLGFDSDANRIANEAPSRLGNLVYAYGALRALAAWRPARFTLTIGEERSFAVGYSVGAANSKAYGGGMYAAPDAELDDGLLDIVVCEEVPKHRFLTGVMPRVFKGTHVHLPQVHVLRAPEVVIESDRPFTVYADGDPIGSTPITLRAVRHALRVLVPR